MKIKYVCQEEEIFTDREWYDEDTIQRLVKDFYSVVEVRVDSNNLVITVILEYNN